MGILNWFESCSNEELETAKNVVRILSIASITSFMPLMKHLPILEAIPKNNRLDKFDYYCTCASAMLFMSGASKKSEQVAMKRALKDWRKDSFKDTMELAKYLGEQNFSNAENMAPYIGHWIIQMVASDPQDNIQIKNLSNFGNTTHTLGRFIMAQLENAF